MRKTRPAALAALLALAPAAGAAAAGEGIRLGRGEARLRPFVELEGRYDSDVAFGLAAGAPADLVVHLRPGLSLTVPGERLALELSASVDRAQYLGIDYEETSDLSRFYAEAALALGVNRDGAIGLELEEDFRRSPSTSAFAFGGAVLSTRNALRAAVPWRRGGGALTVALAGGWIRETFEPFVEGFPCAGAAGRACDAAALDDLGYDHLRGGAEVRWRFLPRTSAVLEAGWFSREPHEPAVADEVSGVEATAGITGLVTPRLGATVKLGWADTLGSLDEDVGTLLAAVELEWSPARTAALRAGYERALGVDPGTILSVYTADRWTAGALLALGRRVSARAEVAWEQRSFELAPSGAESSLLVLEPSLEAAVTPWMTATLGYTYTDRSSSSEIGAEAPVGFEYSKSEGWLRLSARY